MYAYDFKKIFETLVLSDSIQNNRENYKIKINRILINNFKL